MLDDTFKINYKSLPIAVSLKTPVHTSTHNHKEFEIIFFRKSGAKVCINQNTYIVKKGDMVFINPYEIHSILFDESPEKSDRLCICFDINIIIDTKTAQEINDEDLRIFHHFTAADNTTKYLKKEFLNVINAYFEDTPQTDFEITAHLSLMFSYLIKNSLTKQKELSSKDTVFCSKVIKFIEDNYEKDITSKEAAYALSYNQSYFCRTFKKNFHKTFSEYLNMYRIANSRLLLEDKSVNVTKAAAKIGFNSYSYFSKCFKKYTGILPSEYLKTNINHSSDILKP